MRHGETRERSLVLEVKTMSENNKIERHRLVDLPNDKIRWFWAWGQAECVRDMSTREMAKWLNDMAAGKDVVAKTRKEWIDDLTGNECGICGGTITEETAIALVGDWTISIVCIECGQEEERQEEEK